MSENKTVAEQHAIIGNTVSERAFQRTTHPDADWFYHPVKLGLFIHYGISTVHGDLDISWGMMDNPARRAKGNGIVTPREYWALAEQFHPRKLSSRGMARRGKGCRLLLCGVHNTPPRRLFYVALRGQRLFDKKLHERTRPRRRICRRLP